MINIARAQKYIGLIEEKQSLLVISKLNNKRKLPLEHF
jgi:hypothetical protein